MKDKKKTRKQLISELAQMRYRIAELERAEADHKRVEETLRERVKELNCLYYIADIVHKTDTIEKIFQKTVELIPGSWYNSKIACARITYANQEFKTENYRETTWKMSADILVRNRPIGSVEVSYLEEMPCRDEGPFFKEERDLLNVIADSLGSVAENMWTRNTYNRAIEGFYQSIPEGRYINVNRSFARICGYDSPEELIENITDIGQQLYVDPQDRIRFKDLLAEKDVIENYETQFRRKDGSKIWIAFSAHTVSDLEGNIICYEGMVEDITKLKQVNEEREKLIDELKKALLDVKKLSGLLPICSCCKKIRNDEGYWEQLEVYIRDRTEAEFSHSLCPECAKKLYPELYDDKI